MVNIVLSVLSKVDRNLTVFSMGGKRDNDGGEEFLAIMWSGSVKECDEAMLRGEVNTETSNGRGGHDRLDQSKIPISLACIVAWSSRLDVLLKLSLEHVGIRRWVSCG